jgi:hypothetical protein
LAAIEVEVIRKIVGKTKIGGIEAKKSKNPAVSNQLIIGWKEEVENETNMYQEYMLRD